MGPSIAEGSQGCRPNCADLPVAAIMNPIRGRVMLMSFVNREIC